jgi:regulatory protein
VTGASAGGREPDDTARDICLRLLAARPRTRAELRAALAKRGLPEEVVERVLDRFEELGWVDDAAFADQWVQSRHATRGLSRRALGQELRRRGVEPETVELAVGGLHERAEEETAHALARRRAAATAGLDRQVRVRRLTAMLLRRGYPPDLATRAVLRALEDGPEAVPDADVADDLLGDDDVRDLDDGHDPRQVRPPGQWGRRRLGRRQ